MKLDIIDFHGRQLCVGDYVRSCSVYQIVMVHSVPYLQELGKSTEKFLDEDVYVYPELQHRVTPNRNGRIDYIFVDLENEAE